MITTQAKNSYFYFELEARDMLSEWRGFLDAVKELVPSSDRGYDPSSYTWRIAEKYKQGVEILAKQYRIEVKSVL